MNRYSVLLLYPDYANDTGIETFYGWTAAATPVQAVAQVQKEATAANGNEIYDPADFAPLLVMEGHVEAVHYGTEL
jgi:hypothetical protein